MKTSPWKWLIIFVFLLSHAQLQAEEKTAPSLNLANLAIPESLGKIDERFEGSSKRWVINIQDVHAHFGAQENIAAILDHLNTVYGLRLVAYEGGWNKTSYPQTWEIPSSRQKQLVLRTLLEEDIITGPAFTAMNSKTPVSLHGIEEPALYKKNLKVYLRFIENRNVTEQTIQKFEDTLSHEKNQLYNADLLTFDKALLKFKDDAKQAESFLPKLLGQVNQLQVDLQPYPQMMLFKQIHRLEKTIDKDKLKSETERLMQEHKTSRLSFEEMLRHGTFTDEKLSFYPNVQKQSELLKLHDQMIHEQFFQEIDQLVAKVKSLLFKTDAEKTLDARFDRFMTAKKLMLFKATPSDLKVYRNSKSKVRSEMKMAGLEKFLKLGVHFYNLAEKRDLVFFKTITSAPELVSEDLALIAGGFHTEGLRAQLRKSGVSYIVITPNLGQEAPNESLYFKQLLNLKALTQTLSEIGNRLSDGQDARIADAVRRFSAGDFRDIRQVASYVDRPLAASSTKTATAQDFMTLGKEAQLKVVDAAIDSILSGEQPIALVVRADVLKKILSSSPIAESLLKAAMQNPANHITVLYKSFVDVPDVISDAYGNDNVKTVGETDLNRAITRQRELQNALKENKLAIIANDFEYSGALILKETPTALLLFRPILEQGFQFSLDNPETLALISSLAEQVLAAKGLLAAA